MDYREQEIEQEKRLEVENGRIDVDIHLVPTTIFANMKLLVLRIMYSSRTHHFVTSTSSIKYFYYCLQQPTLFNNSSSSINNIYAGEPIRWHFFFVNGSVHMKLPT